jgi:hypothetical protein
MQISKCNVISGYGEFLPLIFSLHFRRKSSNVALEEEFEDAKGAIRIHQLISYFFRPYYLFNQYRKFCNRKRYIPTAKDDNSNCEQ